MKEETYTKLKHRAVELSREVVRLKSARSRNPNTNQELAYLLILIYQAEIDEITRMITPYEIMYLERMYG